jgi:Uma2 family endonuclease
MSPSAEHEELKHLVALCVEILAEEMGLNVRGFGSTTFRREDLERGFEPDACFYVQNAGRIRGKTELDLTVDPPPDVVIAIDLTSPSLAKFPIFAQLGIPEVWCFAGRGWHIFQPGNGTYREHAESLALPGLTAAILTDFLDQSRTLERLVWLRRLRTWARELHPGEAPR